MAGTASDSILARPGGGGGATAPTPLTPPTPARAHRRRRSAATATAPETENKTQTSILPSPSTLLNLAVAFAAGVCVGEWTRQSRVNRRRRRHDALARGVSSLASPPGRRVVVVTTAALPWRTGTAVNPALRAAHLSAAGLRVTLLVPWLPPSEQPLVYPPGQVFQTPEEQAEHVVADAQKRAGFSPGSPLGRFRVAWYPSRYFSALGSILPIGDVTECVPPDDVQGKCAVVLEEPEHLTWFAHKTRWTQRFQHVVGVMHTNYLAYVSEGLHGGASGAVAASALYRINKWTCRLHCHKVIKLSDAVQRLPRQATCNVHGVASCFLEQGKKVAEAAAEAKAGEAGTTSSSSPFSKGAYFIGKAVWGKGWRELIELLDYAQQKREHDEEQEQEEGGGAPDATTAEQETEDVVDLFGGGEDLEAIEREASARNLRVSFRGPADHSDSSIIAPYRVFLNPSTSDVVATTTAEALAMGKWAVVEDLPCNTFFRQFSNCLIYRTPDEFAAHLSRALSEDPAPMKAEDLRALSWEAATERFLRASEIAPAEWPSEAERRYGSLLWRMYRSVTGFRLLRQALGLAVVEQVQQEQQEHQQQLQPGPPLAGARPVRSGRGKGKGKKGKGRGGEGEENEEGHDDDDEEEFGRVADLEEADLLLSKGLEWFRSSSGADDDHHHHHDHDGLAPSLALARAAARA